MDKFRLLKEKDDQKALRKNKEIGSDLIDTIAIEIFSENFYQFQGLTSEYKHLLDLKFQLAQLQLKYLTTNKRLLVNDIRRKSVQIEEQEKKLSGGMSISEAKTYIEEQMKVSLQFENLTVEDFYSKLNYYGGKH
jgi:hypothetical protein